MTTLSHASISDLLLLTMPKVLSLHPVICLVGVLLILVGHEGTTPIVGWDLVLSASGCALLIVA